MALASKSFKDFFKTSGGGQDEINATTKLHLESAITSDVSRGSKSDIDNRDLGPLIYNLQNLSIDVDEVRRFIEEPCEVPYYGGVMCVSSVLYIPFTASDISGRGTSRTTYTQYGMMSATEFGDEQRLGGVVERVIPLGFKATGCIVYGDGSSNKHRGYEGAINANTSTAQGASTDVNVASDFTTQGGSDIVGDGVKTCAVYITTAVTRDLIYGGKIFLEEV